MAKKVEEVTASARASKGVQLQELDVRSIEFWLVGTSPLIVHRFGEKQKRQIEDKQQQKGVKGREAKDPMSEYQSCFYLMDDGHYGFPLTAFKKAAVSACTSTGKALAKTQARQFFHILGNTLLRIYHPDDCPPRMPVEGDCVRVGPSKVADIRYRPYFDQWAVRLQVVYNARVISEHQLTNLFNLAGFAVGVGDWRVEKDGVNGMFTVGNKPAWAKE